MHGLLSERYLWNRERVVQREQNALQHCLKVHKFVLWKNREVNTVSQNLLNNWKLLSKFLKQRHTLSNRKECASCYTSLQESFLEKALSYLMSLRKGWRPSSMTAMKESPQPGNSISAPVHTTVEGIKDEWSNMIRTGELSVGEECTPHTITKYSTAGGDLTAKTTTVYGLRYQC